MSSVILQQFSTIFTVYFTDVFQSGNRVLDNALIALAVMLVGTIMNSLITNWRNYYNCMIYHLYNMKNHPFDIRRAPYILPSSVPYDNMANFMQDNTAVYLSWYDKVDETIPIDMNSSNVLSVINNYIRMNNISPVKNNNNTRIFSNDHPVNSIIASGVYIIDITAYGNYIYYNNEEHILVSYDREYVRAYVYSFMRKIYDSMQAEKLLNQSMDAIYIPSFEKTKGTLEKVGNVNKKKTFDSLFFPQKKQLLEILEKFQRKELYPTHIGMDNKLGILLYGPPGTGKTGTITAIANMLKRNLVLINFTSVTTCGELDAILKPERFKDHIFVFDEFDCILDALGKGGTDSKKEGKSDWGSMLLAAEGEERKTIIEMMREGKKAVASQPIDMAYLLQKLDGIVSAEDRMIIATTNNPDKINPALLRPGRFDMKLCLGKCTHTMIAEILQYYYDGRQDVYDQIMATPLPEEMISPLELMNAAMQAPGFDALLRDLKRMKELGRFESAKLAAV